MGCPISQQQFELSKSRRDLDLAILSGRYDLISEYEQLFNKALERALADKCKNRDLIIAELRKGLELYQQMVNFEQN